MNNPGPGELQAKLARIAAHLAMPERAPTPAHVIGPESVDAREVVARRGRFWQRRIGYTPREPWGETWVEDLCQQAAGAGLRVPLSARDRQFPLTECLFVDCETTGLAGGAGTVAFLIAVGRFDGAEFVVDQYFLPDLADEAGALDELAARFENAAALVTYNGASFDLPLLEGRFNFWRIDSEFRELPHLDLLWPTRALFKHRLPNCSLAQVEESLLRIARIEDLPGAEVPEVYFEYLRQGSSPRLHAVFEHNRLDVVSLFVYALWLNERTQPQRPGLDSAADLQALARFWYRHREHQPALRALEEAASRVNDAAERAAIHRLRGLILKREREYETAHREWEHAAASTPHDVSIAEELAKHLEHRRRDYRGALEIVDKALTGLEFRAATGDLTAEGLRQRLLQRQTRLRRKLRAS